MKKAIILAAGVGRRLSPITNSRPKSMVKVAGSPILEYQIKGYIDSGLKQEDIYIIVGYCKELIVTFIKEKYPNINIIDNLFYDKSNNMYSLYLALQELEKNNFCDCLFINNADCIYSNELMFNFINSDLKNAIAIKKGEYDAESMKVILNNKAAIVDIAKIIKKEDSCGISLDLYKYEKKSIIKLYNIIRDFIEEKKDLNSWTEVAFPILFKNTFVEVYDAGDKSWVEVDNFEDLLKADKIFSKLDITKKKAIAFDLDGTIYLGNKPIKTAIDFINKNKSIYDFYFISNNTSKTPEMTFNKLKDMGIKTSIDKVINPLIPLIDYIKEHSYSSLYLVANKKVEIYLKSKLPNIDWGFNPKYNQGIILCYDNEITYKKMKNLSEILNLNNNINYIATHSDVYCPSEKGAIPDIGSFIELISLTTKKIPDVIIGKPNKAILNSLFEKYNKSDVLYIGDRLYTDHKLAINCGCDFACVLTGETSRSDIEDEINFPDLILKDLSSIN